MWADFPVNVDFVVDFFDIKYVFNIYLKLEFGFFWLCGILNCKICD
jgi:hypothetical protein